MAFFLEELRLDGLEVTSVQECEIKSQMGSHGYLYLSAYIEEELEVLYHRELYKKIHLYVQKQNSRTTLFYGIITNLEITCIGELRLLVLEAKTLSYLMDIEEHSRSFQNKKLTFLEIAEQITLEYGAHFQFYAEDKEIGEWLIQYEETDWQFLNRILSMIGAVMTPAADYEILSVYAGIPELDTFEVPYEITSMDKDMLSYYYHRENGQDAYSAYYTRYQIVSPVMIRIFNQITVSQIDFSIISSSYYFVNGQMVCGYLVQKKNGIKILPQYPMHMVGIALQGKVIGVDADMVQVHLDIDQQWDSTGAYWLPYSTVSAASDGTGWYCMPEHGDLAKVYFPCKEISKAIALNAVNEYPEPSTGKDHMGDVNRVYLSTVHDKKLILDGKRVKISSNGGATSVEILADGTISLNALNRVKLNAEQDVNLFAEGKIEFLSSLGSSVTDESMSGSITVSGGGGILLTGKDILID